MFSLYMIYTHKPLGIAQVSSPPPPGEWNWNQYQLLGRLTPGGNSALHEHIPVLDWKSKANNSTKKRVRGGYPTRVKLTQTNVHAQSKPRSPVLNANHVLLAHIGARIGHYRHTLGMIYLRWALLTRVGHYWLALGGRVGSARFFGYQHVGIGNAKS